MHALDQIGDEWFMRDRGRKVAIIRQVHIERPSGVLWRSVTWEDNPARRALIGYFPTIQMAAAVTWRTWVQRERPVEQRANL